ncbi:MAG TPA: long-chain-acyl-CoA synthetase [Xanthobacteraceae bacterium]|nr:long-chain-acyl-CoA synthetase [Xanthobacteraceae bacterium]
MTLLERLRNDAVFLAGALRALRHASPIAKNPTRVFPVVMAELAARYGDKPALISEAETLTYRGLAERANRYARWALSQGLRKGDTVCLLMPNRPEYVAIWLGIIQAGGAVALLNTNLVGPSLARCIDLVAPTHVIVANTLASALASAAPHLKSAPQVWSHGGGAVSARRIDRVVAELSGAPLSAAQRPALTIEDHALFIYTSGTTGMPKAANINHYRLMLAALGFAGVMATRASDRMYDCLPMYHTTGGVVAIGALLVKGGSVVIRDKFSASAFWDDIARHECTIFQYVGELCRYLVNAPPHPAEARHRLRLACGNGLRPDVWPAFAKRFHIPRIIEFYAATEGNVTLFNFEGRPGAIGRLPRLLERRFPVRIVKFDVAREAPLRDARGFCIRCAADEVGEAIGRIVNDPAAPSGRFEGYADRAESEAKILRDVFEPGDAWFRTGDLMRQDRHGYFYFVDRIGDTFRWKGENVATGEVAEILNRCPRIRDANVYGVAVAGHEGRAGMAAIVADPGFDLVRLRAHVHALLPDYARPLFVRLSDELEVTMTFKQKKTELVAQGFDPTQCADAVYFDDPRAAAYVRLDHALYEEIVKGAVRL